MRWTPSSSRSTWARRRAGGTCTTPPGGPWRVVAGRSPIPSGATRAAPARSTRTRWPTRSARSSPTSSPGRSGAGSPAWRWTPSRRPWSRSVPTAGPSARATPTPTPGPAPRSPPCGASSTRRRCSSAPAAACTAAISPRGCGGCGRPTPSGSPPHGGGCPWASTSTCGCSGRPRRARPPARGPAPPAAAPGAGTPRGAAAGTARAAWTGLLDRRTGRWDSQMLRAAGVGADQLSEVRDPDRPLTEVDPGVARRWPVLAGARWFAPIADGFASNLGTGASDGTTAAVAAATSGAIRALVDDIPERIPPGLWCYRADSRRSLLGGALNDAGRVVSWLQNTVALGDADPNHGRAAAPEPATPLVLPYLSGERSTGWAASARALIAGVSTATSGALIFRGAMEGVALAYARIADQLRTTAANPQRILASGRIAQELPSWLQVLADVLDAPVEPVTLKRATLHGTALHALEVLAPDTPRAPLATAATLHPVPAHHDHYRARAQQYDDVYRAVIAPDRPR